MHPAAHILMAQSHQQDLRRAASRSVLRAEARRAAAEGSNSSRTERGITLHPSPFRRLAARFAV
jgi:hypothetical protein